MTAIYRLEPVAQKGDPNWDRAPNQGVVLVRADSPADARIVAAEAELDFPAADAKPGDGTTTRFASAFRDDKLYRVVEDESGGHSAEGPREVVEGSIDRDVLKA